MQANKYSSLFIFSSGVILIITAIGKLISVSGSVRILQEHDPILAIPFRDVFLIVGGLELVVAAVCLFGKRLGLQAGLIAFLATDFVIYRLGLLLIGYHRPCHCLGNLTDALHISPETANTAMKIILAYLLVGSYAALFWILRQKRKALPVAPLSKTNASAA